MSPRLSVRALGVTLDGTAIVNDVDLEISAGEVTGLVGESGSGKSMTALALLGLLPQEARATGSVRLNGIELLGAPEAELRLVRGRRIGIVFQEPATALNPLMTIGDQVAEVLREHDRISHADALSRAIAVLERVGLGGASAAPGRYPHELSGGQRQRVAIAIAIAARPALLVADEPTTALDVTTQAQVLALLARLAAEDGMATLLISHDLAVVASTARRIAIMHRGRIVEQGDVGRVLGTPTHRYTQDLVRDYSPAPPLPRLAPKLFSAADKFCLVTDRKCFSVFKRGFDRLLGNASGRTVVFETPNGAAAKNFKTLERLLAFMLKNGVSRSSLIIAAGGGSVTDLAGLAAALYMRGIKWVSVPTTLLGQADAGIGGKTAVNLGGLKNIAGAFYQPDFTVCDTSFLDSLSATELRAGAGELLKYALIAPVKPGREVLRNLSAALKGGKKELSAITSACAVFKLDLVSRDEREETGLRETLNFGHTAGHAFEAASNGSLSHGYAVLWGMRYAAMLSYKLGIMDRKAAPAVQAALQIIEPPALKTPCLNFERFNMFIRRDKKSGAHTNRFMLIVRPGVLKGVNNIPDRILKQTLRELA